MLKTIVVLMTFSLPHVSMAMDARHQDLLTAARSGDVVTLKTFLSPADSTIEKYTPTEHETRELANAAFVNKRSAILRTLLEIPSLSCPVNLSDPTINIDKSNDIFAYNICSRTAFCHISIKTPNCNIHTTRPITYTETNERWQFIFEFFKMAEELGHTQLVSFIVQKAHLYNTILRNKLT
ncbi:MAG: hypothetical protein V4482_01570 [Pseudomonadota bacterium]